MGYSKTLAKQRVAKDGLFSDKKEGNPVPKRF